MAASKEKAWSLLSHQPVVSIRKQYEIVYWQGFGMTKRQAVMLAANMLANYRVPPRVKREIYAEFKLAVRDGVIDDVEEHELSTYDDAGNGMFNFLGRRLIPVMTKIKDNNPSNPSKNILLLLIGENYGLEQLDQN